MRTRLCHVVALGTGALLALSGLVIAGSPSSASAVSNPVSNPVRAMTTTLPLGTATGLTSTATGNGFWIALGDGKVVPNGDAVFYGDMSAVHLNQSIVGIQATATGKGYWLVAADGGIFSFGDAPFYGSTGNLRLNQPVTAIAPTPDGGGYWMVATDGGIFAFGNAQFYGSMGAVHLNRPVVGMTVSPSGHGYRMVASDGGVFSFGDAPFYGSGRNIPVPPGLGGMAPIPVTDSLPVVGMASVPDNTGYWTVDQGGTTYAFGSAPSYGAVGGGGRFPITAIAANPKSIGIRTLEITGSTWAAGDWPPGGWGNTPAIVSPFPGADVNEPGWDGRNITACYLTGYVNVPGSIVVHLMIDHPTETYGIPILHDGWYDVFIGTHEQKFDYHSGFLTCSDAPGYGPPPGESWTAVHF